MSWPEPDCPPVRVRLLGEDLVAFRGTSGEVGLLEEFCPHRRTSLFLGRNEEDGLRCVYHGWKFDRGGNCVDMMNEPEDSDYHTKVKAISYPVVEMGGVVWAYMGPSDRQPPLPRFEWTQVPDSHRLITKNRQECNWLQALEGGIDTAHAPILHRRITTNTTQPGIGFDTPFVQGKAPKVEVDRTDYGYRYAGIRELDGEEKNFIRAYHYVLPFHQMRPQQFGLSGGTTRTMIAGHCWVPTDDDNSMVFNWLYSYGDEPLSEADRDIERQLGRGPEDLDENYRARKNRDNDWLIDRESPEIRDIHRNRGYQHSGPGGAGKHGRHRGPQHREPGGQRYGHCGCPPHAHGSHRHGSGRRRPARFVRELLQAPCHRLYPARRCGLAGCSGRRDVSTLVQGGSRISTNKKRGTQIWMPPLLFLAGRSTN